jgi:hypothetical protein
LRAFELRKKRARALDFAPIDAQKRKGPMITHRAFSIQPKL